MDKKTTPTFFSFRILFAISIAFSILNFGKLNAQTTFRLGYSGAYGMIPISGGMVQNPAGEFVFAGTNASCQTNHFTWLDVKTHLPDSGQVTELFCKINYP